MTHIFRWQLWTFPHWWIYDYTTACLPLKVLLLIQLVLFIIGYHSMFYLNTTTLLSTHWIICVGNNPNLVLSNVNLFLDTVPSFISCNISNLFQVKERGKNVGKAYKGIRSKFREGGTREVGGELGGSSVSPTSTTTRPRPHTTFITSAATSYRRDLTIKQRLSAGPDR